MSEWDQETGEVIDEAPGISTELASTPHTTFGQIEAPDDGSILAMMASAAQGLVRDQKQLIQRAKQIGGLLAKKGFYRFPAGDKTVEGESINLAQALAQEWGAIVYQTRIVHAEPLAHGGQRVHLRSSVADMRALVCAEVDQVVSTSPPPGKFAKDHEQRERWNSMQVQNASSKVVRNAILDVLPKWYTQPAFEAAKVAAAASTLGTNPDGSKRTLQQARAAAADALTERGCTLPELEQYTEQPFDMWAVPQLDMLRELFSDLKSGRVALEAWRKSLQDAGQQQQPATPRRTALGLPASSGNPVVDDAVKADAAAKGKKGDKAEQPDLPGAGK